MPTTNDT